MMKNKPQLTISLLASNQPEVVRRSLDSLRPIMEAIPCELILIDTSKNAIIHNMLLEYTDLVYEFEWCNDFSKARNEGLRRAKGEWFLYLDDDDWFVEIDELIKFFQSGEYKQYGYANYQVRNFLDETYTNYSDCWVSRMIRIDKDTRFVSKIHEYFTPLRGERKDLYAMTYHSGYIYETPEKKRAHFNRNSSLLLEMIVEEPDNIRWRTHLAQEYCSMGEWESLESFCKECLKITENIDEPTLNIHIGTFYIGLVYALLNLKSYEESLQICQRALEDKRSGEVLKALMHLKYGETFFRLGQWEKAIEQVEEYLHALESVDQESPDVIEQTFALLVGDTLEDDNQRIAYSVLICSQLEKGNTNVLQAHYDKLGWSKPVVHVIEDVEKYFVKAMWKLDYEPIFARVIVDAFKNRNLRELFCKAILEQESQVMEDTESQVYTFRMVLLDFAKAIQAVSAGPQIGDMLGYYNMLQYYVQATCQWYDFLQEQDELYLLGEENPSYIQAALYISDYLELESKDVVQALGALRDAVEVLPDFANGIGSFLLFYGDLEKQRVEKQKREMEELRVQVIGQVKALLESNQAEAALQIIRQLKQMFPEDLEVANLAMEVRLKI